MHRRIETAAAPAGRARAAYAISAARSAKYAPPNSMRFYTECRGHSEKSKKLSGTTLSEVLYKNFVLNSTARVAESGKEIKYIREGEIKFEKIKEFLK